MADTTKQDDAIRAIERINAIVTDDLWEELERFGRSHGAAEIAELHVSVQDEVDLLLLKVFRAFYSSTGLLLLRSAPEAVRLAALTRLQLTVLTLRKIAKGTETLSRSSAMLFHSLFSGSHDSLQAVFVKDLTDNTV
jgi:hypothetical protein